LAANGFIAQVGIEDYDAIIAAMDLFSMHGDEVLATLNVTTHDFLVLFKEAHRGDNHPLPHRRAHSIGGAPQDQRYVILG
jgi:hypothetical protein